MGKFLGFGNGSDGDANLSGVETPIDSSCSGTSGTNSLSATNASFAAGQLILIHQTRGAGAGAWEVKRIASYVAGTITVEGVLDNTYTDGAGNDQAQVRVIKQYRSVLIASGNTFSAKAWNGDVGGIMAFMCSGEVKIEGTLDVAGIDAFGSGPEANGGLGRGFRGFNTIGAPPGTQGESSTAFPIQSGAANGMGGGGSAGPGGTNGGGAGGGHATGGSAGGGAGGTGGGTGGSADLTTMLFGGAGGTADQSNGGAAGGSGGIALIFAQTFTLTGALNVNGGDGGDGTAGGYGGGGGAGGSAFIKANTAVIGTNLILATAGAGGGGGIGSGGAGGVGRVRIEACSISGESNPAASKVEGGHQWCTTGGFIY